MRAHARRLLMFGAVALAAAAHCDDAADPAVQIRQAENRIEQIQERFGPYSPALSEPTAELGQMLIRTGAHADARTAFRRAMQIERVNAGLYTPRQLPFLDMAIESSVAARDWEQVNDDFRYLEWLNYRIHDGGDPELIDALDRIIDWHVAAVHLDAESEKAEHLLRLLDLGERRLALTEQHYDRGHPRQLEQLYELAIQFYYVYIAAHRAGPVGRTLIESMTSAIDHRRSFFLAQEQLADDCYRKGRQLLERAVETARGTPAFTQEAEGVARVYLADWELMFNHNGRAERLYGEAFSALVSAGISPDALQRRFGAPALLPEPGFRLTLDPPEGSRLRGDAADRNPEAIRFIPWAREVPGVQFPDFGRPDDLPTDATRYALARFHVEENGWTENIRIIEVYPEDRSLSRAARQALWYVQFRPRLEGGRVVATRDVEARYQPLE